MSRAYLKCYGFGNALPLRRTRKFTVCDKFNWYSMNDRKYIVKNKIKLRKPMYKYENLKRVLPNVSVKVKNFTYVYFSRITSKCKYLIYMCSRICDNKHGKSGKLLREELRHFSAHKAPCVR